MLRTVILESDVKDQQRLKRQLQQYCPEFCLAGIATDLNAGIKLIQQSKPHLVFFSEHLNKQSGLALFRAFPNPDFESIFLAQDQTNIYAALSAGCFSFLFKPIKSYDLIKVLSKLKSNVPYPKTNNQPNHSNRLVLPAAQGLIFLNHKEIYSLESNGRSTEIHLAAKQAVKSSLSLKECEKLLNGFSFIRIHRSHIINLLHIKKYARGRDAFILLDNDQRIDVGKNYKMGLNRAIEIFLR